MELGFGRRYIRGNFTSPPTAHNKMTSILIAIPFVFCFSMFGIFNLIGGTVLTIMACSSQLTPKAKAIIQRLIRRSNIKIEPQINPMQVVGIILLLTGSLLVIIGLALGIIACRSVNEHQRRRDQRLAFTQLGMPLYSTAERSSRQGFSFCSTSLASSRSRNGKRSLISEKTVSPILEVDSEEESSESYRHDKSVLKSIEDHSPLSVHHQATKINISPTSEKQFVPIQITDSLGSLETSESLQPNLLTVEVMVEGNPKGILISKE